MDGNDKLFGKLQYTRGTLKIQYCSPQLYQIMEYNIGDNIICGFSRLPAEQWLGEHRTYIIANGHT